MALPLLPTARVKEAFDMLDDDRHQLLDKLFEYYENFWLDTLPLELWNVSGLNTRTNNSCEGRIFFLHLR